MQNPWLNLRPESPYILEIDRAAIDRYIQSKRREEARVNCHSIPETFIGNPDSARVVLLSLNPGDSSSDAEDHKREEMRKAMICNLRHEGQEHAFYPLNPEFKETGCGTWWRPRTDELRRAAQLDDETFSQRLLVIEWFPYHSKRSGLPVKPICESQSYSLQLAKEMLEKGKLVVGMRAAVRWKSLDPCFENVPFLKNPQCGYLSRGNTPGDLFDRMVKAIR